MPCGFTALNSTVGCPDNEGGAQYAWAAKLEDITAVTDTAGQISNFTMASVGLWKRLDFDKDSTSFFNQTGERINETGPLRYNAEGLMKFGGHSQAYKAWADDAGDCCKIVIIWVLTNGNRVIQGIEIDAAATGGFTGTKSRDTKGTPSMLSGTSDEEARLEMSIGGRNKQLAPFTTLTDTALAAL